MVTGAKKFMCEDLYILFIRDKLRQAMFLSNGRQPKVSCFPI